MDIIKQQEKKTTALKYLVSKGYHLRAKLTDPTQAPKSLQGAIYTKKIYLFTLTDPKDKEVVDYFVAEYTAIPSEWETMLMNLGS